MPWWRPVGPETLSRGLGGDEFCVFLKDCDLEAPEQVAHRFLQAVVGANVEVSGAPCHPHCQHRGVRIVAGSKYGRCFKRG